MFIIPYLVLAGVVLLFFAVTCLMVFGLPGKKKNAEPIMADLDKTMEIPTISKEKAAASPIAGKPAVDDATRSFRSSGRTMPRKKRRVSLPKRILKIQRLSKLWLLRKRVPSRLSLRLRFWKTSPGWIRSRSILSVIS